MEAARPGRQSVDRLGALFYAASSAFLVLRCAADVRDHRDLLGARAPSRSILGKPEGMERRSTPHLDHALSAGGLLRLRHDRRGAQSGGARRPTLHRGDFWPSEPFLTGTGSELALALIPAAYAAVHPVPVCPNWAPLVVGGTVTRGLPGIGLRGQSAGAASHPAQMTSHENALGWIGRGQEATYSFDL